MMLVFASTCAYLGGTKCEELQCLLDGVVDTDFRMSFCPDAVRTEQLCF